MACSEEWLRGEIGKGRTHQSIADELRVASQTIGKWCKKYEIQCMSRGPRKGPGHPNWKGGRHVDKNGYVLIWLQEHPFAKKSGQVHAGGYVREHRLVMEKRLGRYLLPTEVVHHRNGDHGDNRLENLELFQSNGAHLAHELAGRRPNWSEDGLQRLRERWDRLGEERRAGVHRPRTIQKKSAPDETLSPQTNAQTQG